MIINRNIKSLLIFGFSTIKEALEILDNNHHGYVIVIEESGVVEGIMTDGDFRRWSLKQSDINLNDSVQKVLKKDFDFVYETENDKSIESKLSDERRFIPILDIKKRIVGIAELRKYNIEISNKYINENSECFVIAEIGLNHNGSIDRAIKMIKLAAEAGADCVKFQMRNMSSLYLNKGNADDIKEDLGSQYVLDLLSKFQLSDRDMIKAFDYCKKCNVIPMCTPWDIESLKTLEKYGMESYKVASADFTNHELLLELAKTGKTLICSTGMCTESEILESIKVLKSNSAKYILLQCNSTYPTPYKDVNLKYLKRLKKLGNCFVGYSGHERGYHIVLASVVLGAKVIEKHFTLDKNMEGNDHKVSLLPEEFSDMVVKIRDIEQSLGTSKARIPTQGELMNRNTLSKSLVANKQIKIGEIIKEEMIIIKAPGKGLQPNKKNELIGKKANRKFNIGDFFYMSDLTNNIIKRKNYNFRRPWGNAVRFHDYIDLNKGTNPDFMEFHLSYKDLDYDIDKNFPKIYEMDFTVHSPDTFKGDFLMDLSNENLDHRKRSIKELQKVIDITIKLKKYFNKSNTPLIITSLGGFSTDKLINNDERKKRYDLMSKSLKELNSDGVEIIGQTLPPYPWYFGGQLFLNLFV
ncbi:MAG: CBS domain-containing protein, partial [Flavobacteriaceae bacterium]|nr:CBS domain-containing protein [Flavobacteriaceae bacterium]